jgi:hypothetical protein
VKTTKVRTTTDARRAVERLRMQAAGAGTEQVAIWEAENLVADLERAERESAVRTARAAGRVMDGVLLVVAVLTMAFSLQNIHDFAKGHGVQDPIAWFLAPAVDLALLAALVGDAVLSRYKLDAGDWARRLRWYAGAATLTLNAWEAVASGDPAAIVLHVVPPTLLFVLAEAAVPYRMRFADTVRLAAEQAAEEAVPAVVDTAPVPVADTPPAAVVDTPAPQPQEAVYDQEHDPAVSTMTAQATAPEPPAAPAAPAEADIPTERLDAEAAKRAIEQAWESGLSVREAAVRATRSASYVGGVYARLTKARGPQPVRGQTTIDPSAA